MPNDASCGVGAGGDEGDEGDEGEGGDEGEIFSCLLVPSPQSPIPLFRL